MSDIGRPMLTVQEIDDIFRKVEPYLKKGLSLNKACLEAQVPRSTVYDLVSENVQFAERVEVAKNYHAILVNDIITKELERMKLTSGSIPLTTNELKLVQFVALHSINTRDEFEERDEDDKKKEQPYQHETDKEFREHILNILEGHSDKEEQQTQPI